MAATQVEAETAPVLTQGQESQDSGELAPGLQMLAAALGMDPSATNELQKPDVDFLHQVAILPVNFGQMPSGTDVEGMRKWINEVFLEGDLPKHRANFDFQYRRPVRKVNKEIISISAFDDDAKFDLWVYQAENPLGAPRPAVLMFHGGGWIHGNPAGDEGIAEIFASELDAVVFGVDYRLAPENHFPKPVNDCEQALIWVEKNAPQYNIDTSKIALWGASAGANLAAALGLRVAESEQPEPRLCLISLVVPVTAHPRALERFAKERSFPKGENELLFEEQTPSEAAVREFESLYELYTGKGVDPYNELVSPLMAPSVAKFPVTDVTVAGCDTLRAQGQAFAQYLRTSGVKVTEDILPGVPHMFTLPTNAKVTKTWLKRQVDVLEKAFSA